MKILQIPLNRYPILANPPILYVMRSARKARRAVRSSLKVRLTMIGIGTGAAVLAFGLFAQSRTSEDDGANALLRSMGGDVPTAHDPEIRIPEPGVDVRLDARSRNSRSDRDRVASISKDTDKSRGRVAGSRSKRDSVTRDGRRDKADANPTANRNTKPAKMDDRTGDEGPASTDLPGFPSNLDPTPKTDFAYQAPPVYRGIYITNEIVRIPQYYEKLLKKAHDRGLNTIVADVQLVDKSGVATERLPPDHFMQAARKHGFYLVARVVVFQGGLNSYPPSMAKIDQVLSCAEDAARLGFAEIQLDYIRFADNPSMNKIGLSARYRMISGILKMATDRLRPYGVRVAAAVFGRIVFNNEDIIGQKVELFSKHLDTLYPMLYPSHFYGEADRRKDPYKTIHEGVKSSRARSGNTRIAAYIQAFTLYNKDYKEAGLSYNDYIKVQIKGAEDAGAEGFIAWNAANQYDAFFEAYDSYRQETARKTARQP